MTGLYSHQDLSTRVIVENSHFEIKLIKQSDPASLVNDLISDIKSRCKIFVDPVVKVELIIVVY